MHHTLLPLVALFFTLIIATQCTDFSKYKPIVDQLTQRTRSSHLAFNDLALFIDTFGSRLLGSENLNNSIKWLKDELDSWKIFDDVRLEPVHNVTHWVRGEESLIMTAPRSNLKLKVIGLGMSKGTDGKEVEAPVVVVRDWDELEKYGNAGLIKNKIVVFNAKFESYGKTVAYRFNGPLEASKYGAVAALIRSVTPLSIASPHTGLMNSESPIPGACITIEDSEMLQRMFDRSVSNRKFQTPVLRLRMDAHLEDPVTTYNLVAEVKGSERPDEILIASGHIDSWDTEQETGAMDDAGGVFTSIEALRLIRTLNIPRPKRTIRAIAFVGEEFGGPGANAYAKDHKDENFIFAFESDLGAFDITGLGVSGSASDEAYNILKQVMLLQTENNSTLIERGGGGADIDPLCRQSGCVCASPTMASGCIGRNNNYFLYHHSAGDRMSVLDADELDRNVASIASLMYVVADMDQTLPK